MDKKLWIVILIAIVLIILGGYLIINNHSGEINVESSNISLKEHDFKLFLIKIPEKSKFKIKNEDSSMKYYLNYGKYCDNITGIIINKNLTDSLIGDNSQSILNSTTQKIYTSEFKNQTVYKIVSIHDDVDVIVIGNDLNLLKEISDTIKIKDDNF